MALDADQAAIRTVIAAVLAKLGEESGRGLDALFAMRQAEVIVKALEHAGYEIRRQPVNSAARQVWMRDDPGPYQRQPRLQGPVRPS
jgi:hypothetical protein